MKDYIKKKQDGGRVVAGRDNIPQPVLPRFRPALMQLAPDGTPLGKPTDQGTIRTPYQKSVREKIITGLNHIDDDGDNAVAGIVTQPAKAALRLLRPDRYFDGVQSDADVGRALGGLALDAASVGPIVSEAKQFMPEMPYVEATHKFPYVNIQRQNPIIEGQEWMDNWMKDPTVTNRMYRNNREYLNEANPDDYVARYRTVKKENLTKGESIKSPDAAEGDRIKQYWGADLTSPFSTTAGVYLPDIPADTYYPYKGRSFVNKWSPNKASVTVHELTHQLTDADKGLSQNSQSILQAPFGGPSGISESIANNPNAEDKINYLTQPTEVHARLNELRKYFDLKPGEAVDGQQALDMYKGIKKGNTPVDPRFGDLVKDPKAFKDMFNKMFTPAAIATAMTYKANDSDNK